MYARSNGFDKMYVRKQVACATKVAQTSTQVHYLENMLYKFGQKLDECNNKFYMQQTSCRCGATSYPWRAQVLYKLTQVFLSATARRRDATGLSCLPGNREAGDNPVISAGHSKPKSVCLYIAGIRVESFIWRGRLRHSYQILLLQLSEYKTELTHAARLNVISQVTALTWKWLAYA